jgi:hypothetical protein
MLKISKMLRICCGVNSSMKKSTNQISSTIRLLACTYLEIKQIAKKPGPEVSPAILKT